MISQYKYFSRTQDPQVFFFLSYMWISIYCQFLNTAGYSAVQPVAVMGGSTLKGFVLVIQLGE